jgi:hypothetical protein
MWYSGVCFRDENQDSEAGPFLILKPLTFIRSLTLCAYIFYRRYFDEKNTSIHSPDVDYFHPTGGEFYLLALGGYYTHWVEFFITPSCQTSACKSAKKRGVMLTALSKLDFSLWLLKP